MKLPNHIAWREFPLFLFILGSMFGCTVYMALEERKVRQEIRLNERLRRQQMCAPSPNALPASTHKERLSTTMDKEVDDDGKEYEDPYDNPDFDDLFPGEEYDEEFQDRSEGDSELYDEEE